MTLCQTFGVSKNDSELKFKEYVNKICNIINETLNAVHGFANRMTTEIYS